jgi:hypothetical protein
MNWPRCTDWLGSAPQRARGSGRYLHGGQDEAGARLDRLDTWLLPVLSRHTPEDVAPGRHDEVGR